MHGLLILHSRFIPSLLIFWLRRGDIGNDVIYWFILKYSSLSNKTLNHLSFFCLFIYHLVFQRAGVRSLHTVLPDMSSRVLHIFILEYSGLSNETLNHLLFITCQNFFEICKYVRFSVCYLPKFLWKFASMFIWRFVCVCVCVFLCLCVRKFFDTGHSFWYIFTKLDPSMYLCHVTMPIVFLGQRSNK